MHDLGKAVTRPEKWPAHHGHEGEGVDLVQQVSKRLRVPTDCRDLAVMTAREHGNVAKALELRPRTIVSLFERNDGFRKPERFSQMLLASECDARGREGGGVSFRDRPFPQKEYLEKALAAARGVNAGEIAQRCVDRPEKIPEFVRAARVRAVKEAIGFDGDDSEGGEEST
jgi:tRNA nucleotidyltransferase (CCA-adding enzyme)